MRAWSGVLAIVVGITAGSCQQFDQLKASVSKDVARLQVTRGSATTESPWVRDDADAGPPLVDSLVGKCLLPVHQDDYDGFSIGYPTGWRIDYGTGSIVVAKDAKELVGALVYPARLRKEVPVEDVARAFIRGLEGSITHRGGTFDVSDKRTNGKIATATLKATVGGVALRGPLEVVEKPGFVTLKLYWAPEDTFAADEPTLRQVVTCFQRKTLITARRPVVPAGGPVTHVGAGGGSSGGGSSGGGGSGGSGPATTSPSGSAADGPAQALQPYHGKFYDAGMPAGWKLTDETGYGIDMIAGDGSMGVGFGLVIVPLKNAQTFTQADQLKGITQIWPGVRLLKWGRVPGGPQGVVSFGAEWEGSPHGVPTHGYSQANFVQGMQTSISYTTAPERWAANKATMAAVAASVRIQPAAYTKESADRRAQLAMYARLYPPPSSATTSSAGGSGSASDSLMASWKARQDAQDRTNLGFDDAIRGQDRALSPSTGEEYVVPNSAWSTEGPAGPGYYRATPGGGSELLNVETNAGGSAPL